jgi:acyl-coenzyme A synthetase/AMP-(fatty) acid ligase/acyl carrier protein
MQATPVTWRMLLAADWKPAPGFQVWCGGEMLPQELAGAILKHNVKMWNVYGPTETTIWSTVHEVENVRLASAIGRPILNTQVYVLDANGNLLPPGLPGELYLGGAGVARAYLNQPALTAEKLVPDPFSQNSGARLYRTGDLARFTSNGILECFGRTDLQQKIDGFRIELGDVEAALSSIPGIQHAAAAVVSDQNKTNCLVAFLVYDPSQAPYETSALRKMMMDRLPAYMVPSSFTEVAALPLTANNKLDRKRLTGMARPAMPKPAQPPTNAVEEALVEIWKEAFEKSEIYIDDNFFDIGGHSLIATQIHVKIQRVFQIELALRELFHSPTIRALAAIIQQGERSPGRSDKIASLYLKVKHMSPEEREHLLLSGKASR